MKVFCASHTFIGSWDIKGFQIQSPSPATGGIATSVAEFGTHPGCRILGIQKPSFFHARFWFLHGLPNQKIAIVLRADPQKATEISFWLLFLPFTVTRNLFQAAACACDACCTTVPAAKCQQRNASFCIRLHSGRQDEKKRVAALCTWKCGSSASKPFCVIPDIPCNPREKMKIPFQRGGETCNHH